jgi:hypothetical protein
MRLAFHAEFAYIGGEIGPLLTYELFKKAFLGHFCRSVRRHFGSRC